MAALPVLEKFDSSKDSIIDAFPEAVKELGMRIMGCNHELGMLSFGKEGEPVFHAHIVGQKDKSTGVEIAPGLSFMKDRSQSEMPTAAINKIMNALRKALKTEKI